MASGKRASMREGPLSALFRKTETEGLQSPGDQPAAPEAPPAPPAPAPVAADAYRQLAKEVLSNGRP